METKTTATVKVDEYQGKTVEVAIWMQNGDVEVTVRRMVRFGEPQPAQVNWPGCGARSAAYARSFAALVSTATEAAEALDALLPGEFEILDAEMVQDHLKELEVYPA